MLQRRFVEDGSNEKRKDQRRRIWRAYRSMLRDEVLEDAILKLNPVVYPVFLDIGPGDKPVPLEVAELAGIFFFDAFIAI